MDRDFYYLLEKKTRTILIPFLLFNIVLIPFLFGIQYWHIVDHDFSVRLYPFDLMEWANAVLAIDGSPINYPLNFLRDLYLVSLLSPLMGFAMRRAPWVGLAAVIVIFWFDLDGSLILRNDMPITFYCGGMLVIRGFDPAALDRFAFPLLLVFIGLCFAVVWLDIENRNYLRVVSPLLIWPAASLAVHTRFGDWVVGHSKYSFFIFLTHGPLLLLMWVLYNKFYPELPYWIWWIVTPLVSVAFLTLLSKVLRKAFPIVTRFALGGR